MEQRLLPIHLCPQCGSRYRYMFLDEECPDCNYKFEKEESLNMTVHCPFCLADELAMRIRPYWSRVSGDPALNDFYETLKEKTEKSYVKIAVKHIKYKLLINHFENFARTGIFELHCEQCGKNLCEEGNNFVLLMKDAEIPNLQDNEVSHESQAHESHVTSSQGIVSSRKGCTFLLVLCIMIVLSSVIVSCIIR